MAWQQAPRSGMRSLMAQRHSTSYGCCAGGITAALAIIPLPCGSFTCNLTIQKGKKVIRRKWFAFLSSACDAERSHCLSSIVDAMQCSAVLPCLCDAYDNEIRVVDDAMKVFATSQHCFRSAAIKVIATFQHWFRSAAAAMTCNSGTQLALSDAVEQRLKQRKAWPFKYNQ